MTKCSIKSCSLWVLVLQAVVARFSKEKETVLLIGSSGFVGVRIQQLHFETYQAPFNLVCVDLGAPKEMRCLD